MMTTQLTINLGDVSFATLRYDNDLGFSRRIKPRFLTCNGQQLPSQEIAKPFHSDYPGETVIERCRRLNVIDTWTPICVYHFRNRKTLTFKGEEALSKFKAYRTHIYGTKRKSTSST